MSRVDVAKVEDLELVDAEALRSGGTALDFDPEAVRRAFRGEHWNHNRTTAPSAARTVTR